MWLRRPRAATSGRPRCTRSSDAGALYTERGPGPAGGRRTAPASGRGGKGRGKKHGGKGSAHATELHGFLVGDMGDRNLGDRIDVEYERLVKGGALTSSSSQTIFDVVAIQFALHYACGEVERVQRNTRWTWYLTASTSLRDGISTSRSLVTDLA